MSPQPKDASPWRQVGTVMNLVFIVPAGVLVGALVGVWLDRTVGTKWVFTVMLVGLGFVGGLLELLRALKRLNRQ